MERDKLEEKLAARRANIDEVDAQLVACIAQRMVIADEIGHIKTLLGLPSVDRKREEEVKQRVARMAATYELYGGMLMEIYGLMLAETHERRRLATKQEPAGGA